MLNNSIALHNNKIINLDSIHQKTLVGYIVGGIESPDSNIAATGSTLSYACTRFYKVYIDRPLDGITYPKVKEPVSLIYYPNPFKGKINFELSAAQSTSVTVSILDEDGCTVETLFNKTLNAGSAFFQWNAKHFASGIYFCCIRTNNYSKIYKLVLAD